MTRVLFYWALLTGTFIYALHRGGKEERLAAAVCLLATIISVELSLPLTQRYAGIAYGELAVDFLVLGLFVTLALRSRRFWPLWIAGLQLASLTGHLIKTFDPQMMPIVYAIATRSWSYPILIIVLIGTWRGARRREVASETHRHGSDVLPA